MGIPDPTIPESAGFPVERMDLPRRENGGSIGTARNLARRLEPIPATLPVSLFLERLRDEKGGPRVFPVVERNRPLGILDRLQFLEAMNSPFARDLFGRRPVREFIAPGTPRFEADVPLEAVIRTLTGGIDPIHSAGGNDCFLVVDHGEYLGMGFVLDLLGRIHETQLNLARQANPLTGLPGNAPIERRMAELLGRKEGFRLAYCDLDNFKAFNDRYGYARGDAMILLVARILAETFHPEEESANGFVGHIGGDDFIVVAPWDVPHRTWEAILAEFAARVPSLYDDQDRRAAGILGKDRRGKDVFHPLATLSIGVVPCPPDRFGHPREISEVAAEIKCQAKRIMGNSWFQERRENHGSEHGAV